MKKLITAIKSIPFLPMFKLLNDWKGFVRFHFLHAAFESGLIEALEKPADLKTVSASLKSERRDLLEALLNLGVALKELSCRRGTYSLKGRRIKMLRGEKGDKFAAWIQAHVNYYNSAYRHFSDRLHGAPDGDYLTRFGDLVARASKMLDPFISVYIEKNINKEEKLRILEVGCGSGIYLKTASEVNDRLHGVAIDYDEAVVAQARENILSWGLDKKFSVKQKDIFTIDREPEGRFDIVTMYNLIYYFPVDKRLELMKKLKTCLADDGTLILVSSEQGKSPSAGTANLDVINRSIRGCYEIPSEGEIETLLDKAGFKLIKKSSIVPGESIYGYLAQLRQ